MKHLIVNFIVRHTDRCVENCSAEGFSYVEWSFCEDADVGLS